MAKHRSQKLKNWEWNSYNFISYVKEKMQQVNQGFCWATIGEFNAGLGSEEDSEAE